MTCTIKSITEAIADVYGTETELSFDSHQQTEEDIDLLIDELFN